MQTLVTGANGFLGAALCRKLLKAGHRIRGMVRKTSDLSALAGVPIEKTIGSLDDPESLRQAVKDCDTVFHAAGAVSDYGSESYFRRVNVDGTRSILEAAVRARVRRFVYISSAAVHSFTGERNMDEESPQRPTRFHYCRSKREAEKVVMQAHREGRIETVIVRPGDIYGPGDRVVLLKMASLLEKGYMALVSGGRSLGAFTYVENLADGILLAGTVRQASGNAYIVTDGIELTWKAYFDRLTDALEVPRVRIFIPAPAAWCAAAILETLYRGFRIPGRPPVTRYLVAHLRGDFHFSIEKARRELGYAPRVGLDEAIRRTAVWYKQTVRGERPEQTVRSGA